MNQEKRRQQAEEELETKLMEILVSRVGYSIVESRCNNKKFEYRIKRERP